MATLFDDGPAYIIDVQKWKSQCCLQTMATIEAF